MANLREGLVDQLTHSFWFYFYVASTLSAKNLMFLFKKYCIRLYTDYSQNSIACLIFVSKYTIFIFWECTYVVCLIITNIAIVQNIIAWRRLMHGILFKQS